MASTQPSRRYTAAEYLELDRKAECKSEFLNGQIFSMAGASPRHSIGTHSIGTGYQHRFRAQGIDDCIQPPCAWGKSRTRAAISSER